MENLENVSALELMRRNDSKLSVTAENFGETRAIDANGNFSLFFVPSLSPIAQAFTNAAVSRSEIVTDKNGKETSVSVTSKFRLVNASGTRETVTITNPEIQKWVNVYAAASTAENLSVRMKCVSLSRLSTTENLRALGFDSFQTMANSMFGVTKEYAAILVHIGATFFNDDFSAVNPLFENFTISHLQELYRLESVETGLAAKLLESGEIPQNSSVAKLRKAITEYMQNKGLANPRKPRKQITNGKTENAAQEGKTENAAQEAKTENAAQEGKSGETDKSTYENAAQEDEKPHENSRMENIAALLSAIQKAKTAGKALFNKDEQEALNVALDAAINVIQQIVTKEANTAKSETAE